MAGHSKWANIKHRKGRQDKLRAKIFTKLGKELTIAAKEGGGNPEFNSRLRLAIEKAKAGNMPKDNIERAIKKGTGELEGVEYLEIRYEGYGPGGVAFIVDVVTDNKNRSASSVRSTFSKKDGNLGADGTVAWMFDKKGVFLIENKNIDEEEIMLMAIDSGAEDIKNEGDFYEVTCEMEEFHKLKQAFDDSSYTYTEAEISMLPKNKVTIEDEEVAKKILDLYETLEDLEDVQNLYANFDISNELMEKILT